MISGRALAEHVAGKMAAYALGAFFAGCFLAVVIGGVFAVIQSLSEDRELQIYRERGGIVSEWVDGSKVVKYKGEFYEMTPVTQ